MAERNLTCEDRSGSWTEVPNSRLHLRLAPEGFGRKPLHTTGKSLLVEILGATLPRTAAMSLLCVCL